MPRNVSNSDIASTIVYALRQRGNLTPEQIRMVARIDNQPVGASGRIESMLDRFAKHETVICNDGRYLLVDPDCPMPDELIDEIKRLDKKTADDRDRRMESARQAKNDRQRERRRLQDMIAHPINTEGMMIPCAAPSHSESLENLTRAVDGLREEIHALRSIAAEVVNILDDLGMEKIKAIAGATPKDDTAHLPKYDKINMTIGKPNHGKR